MVFISELGSEITITWAIFNYEFNWHFFPRVVQEAEVGEFMDLVQGKILVIEYAAKFLQLSQFGMYLIPNEERKVKNFERDLDTRILTMMTCFDICNFSQLYY